MRVANRSRFLAAIIGLAVFQGQGCVTSAPRSFQYVTTGAKPVTADGLYQVRSSRVGGAFIKPDARFSEYDKVMIDPVSVAYKSEPQRPDATNRSRGNFKLDDTAMKRLKQIYHDAFDREFRGDDAFSLVYDPGPGVMRISGHIVNLVVNAPPVQGGEEDYLVSGGEMTLILDVRDSVSLDPLTRLVDRREIRPGTTAMSGGYQSGAATNWGGVRDLCRNWTSVLRDWLGDLSVSTIPPAPDLAGVAGTPTDER
jgi:hypothetical protein